MTPRQPGWNSAVPERVFNNTDWKSVVWTNPQSTASSFQLATLYRMQLSLLTILVVWQHILTSLCLFYGMTWNSSLIQRKSVSPVIRLRCLTQEMSSYSFLSGLVLHSYSSWWPLYKSLLCKKRSAQEVSHVHLASSPPPHLHPPPTPTHTPRSEPYTYIHILIFWKFDINFQCVFILSVPFLLTEELTASPSPVPYPRVSLGHHWWLHNQFPLSFFFFFFSVLNCALGFGELLY